MRLRAGPTSRTVASLLASLALPLVLGTSCGTGVSQAPPNVLLITVDTLRPDRLSAYGYEKHETPAIDRLAAEGALFEQAFTDTPWTTPSMSSVLTGLYPTRHGFKSTNANRLGLEQRTLAEILAEHGYDTAAVVGSFPLDSIYQLDQGFAHYDDAFTTPIWIHPDHDPTPLPSEFRTNPEDQALFVMTKAMSDSRRPDADVTTAALAWLEARDAASPFFLWVHYFGPHTKPNWNIPAEERLERELAAYDPDVRTNDREVGRLLESLEAGGLADDTLVIFHADHGESLGEQGYIGHGVILNDATMRIPLIVRYPPEVRAGVRIATTARNVDIFPTVLEAVGLPLPAESSGRSLLPLLEKGPRGWLRGFLDGEEPIAYMETYYPAHGAFAQQVKIGDTERKIGVIRRSVRSGRWQLIRNEPHPLLDSSDDTWSDVPEPVLESLRSEFLIDALDPSQYPPDLAEQQPELAARLRAELDAQIAAERGVAPRLPVDPETRLRLKSLGYDQ